MMPVTCESSIEDTTIGRIVIPDGVPEGFALFYTTSDVSGRLDPPFAKTVQELVRTRFGIEASLSTCNQVHGRALAHAHEGSGWNECDSCDALWSRSRGTALAIKVADCLPVTLIDPERHVIANIHSGWRGGVQQITASTIDTVVGSSDFHPGASWAWLGPSIRGCCFEVGEEVVDQFVQSYGDLGTFVDRSHRKPHLDLVGITARLLRSKGFAAERILDTGLCTRCDRGAAELRGLSPGASTAGLFHSYRREPKRGGRNLAIAAQ